MIKNWFIIIYYQVLTINEWFLADQPTHRKMPVLTRCTSIFPTIWQDWVSPTPYCLKIRATKSSPSSRIPFRSARCLASFRKPLRNSSSTAARTWFPSANRSWRSLATPTRTRRSWSTGDLGWTLSVNFTQRCFLGKTWRTSWTFQTSTRGRGWGLRVVLRVATCLKFTKMGTSATTWFCRMT